MAYETVANNKKDKVRAAVFASGAGTIAQALIEFGLQAESSYKVVVLLSNNSMCGARIVSEKFGVPFIHISAKTHPEELDYDKAMLGLLKEFNVKVIALAGYNKLMPATICKCYAHNILNIHPALLPKYGGKGMYGRIVHQRVIENKELFSGSTVHLVDEFYDHGEILEQSHIILASNETIETLEAKIKTEEKNLYPKALNTFVKKLQ